MNLQVGGQIDQYVLLNKLGSGGMSEVFLARDEKNQREVVLKFPHDNLMGDPASYERFTREIKIGTLLNHPNIQKLYEVAGEKMNPYLVLEYVKGCTLRELLDKEALLPSAKAVALGVQIARALGYAHANHVFHRDLKPENIIVTAEGQAKVMDFGIAFVEGARRITWGRLSSQIGTPDYMAPEQVKGSRGDVRTDIYALGIMVYEFLAGRPPFQGDNALVIMNQHVTLYPPPLHRFNKHISTDLEEVIMKAIRREPVNRWSSMEAFAGALEQPDKIDVAALKAEREEVELHAPRRTGRANEDNPLGLVVWQIALLILVILAAIIALGFLAQVLHH